ncbi:serine carboxypeptidase-like 20 [Vicia villosa]|uniref:serine carboxypeptidase-like 20 n=1 Tax=Vicia villosa TaxID=3911 RepID=UPI00273BEAD4|nr:serine carboxypeptidase-like 20 [Vicia villosa]
MRNSYLFLLHIFLTFVVTHSAPKGSLITNLPGFNGSLPSKHYGGYVTIDESHGKNLYYYFVESESNSSSKDPIVLWLNGGPGCSSLDGFVYEHGPFNFEKPVPKGALPKLKLNPYSWSKVSNVIYLDSPVGVGFSYSKNLSDYKTGDKQTAADAHTFLLKWFELYPEFLANPLFLAGESYAGVYVPTLADEIVKGIEAGIKPKLNFKGYLIGNPVADKIFDGNALVPFAHGMGLISDQIFENTTKTCNGTFYPPDSVACSNILLKVDHIINRLNIYNILEPCYYADDTEENQNKKSKLPLSFRQLGKTEKSLPIRKRMFGRAWPYGAIVEDGIVPSWPQLTSKSLIAPPCVNDEIASVWLNNPEVRKAIHTAEKSAVSDWYLCTDKLEYDHDLGSMIPYHKNLTAKGYSALIFSGDHDMCVPYTGTEAWTRSLGYKIVDEWRPWLIDNQVAGFTQGYDNKLRFLTVKGSGHTVPEYKPKESLYFYRNFLDGTPI